MADQGGDPTDDPGAASGGAGLVGLLRRTSRAEIAAAALAAVVLVVLVAIEPDIAGAPVQNGTTIAFTLGGTLIAAAALLVMLRLRVPPAARIAVLGIPFIAVNWWLLSPFFIDSAADDEFPTSIAEAGAEADAAGAEADAGPTRPAAAEPVLLGSGSFEGLAGHDGAGEAGVFALPDGSQVLRLERFRIDNGPDLRLYVVPGAAQRTVAAGSISLGKLKGNVGDQTYELPSDMPLTPGPWTVLVWCEAFSVEFVAATVDV